MDYDRPKKASCVRVRFIIALLATFCPIACYISRQNLSMAIVAMVDNQAPSTSATHLLGATNTTGWHSNSNGTTSGGEPSEALDRIDVELEAMGARIDDSCPIEPQLDQDGRPRQQSDGGPATAAGSFGPKYKWEQADKSLVLGAFFWTYVLFQIPAARMAELVGAKWILAVAAIGSSALSFISPWAASVHVYALALVRALMGICQTALFPAGYVLYAKWLPPVERSLAIPILNCGAYVGSIVASSLTGYFSEQESLGWEWAFYTPGFLCALWFGLWLWQGANAPGEHKSISLEEIEYISARMEQRKELGGGGGAGSGGCEPAESAESGLDGRPETPTAGAKMKAKQISWTKLCKSPSIWSMVAAYLSSNWSFTIVLMLLPSYLNDILHIPPFKNGLINSVIYGLYCISSPIIGSGSTMMIETRAFGLSRLSIRKLFESVALFGQALCFVALPLIGCDQSWVLTFLFLQIVLFSFINGGEVHIPTELSVDFSGTIYAIGNCIGSSTGFLAPILHSYIVSNPYSRDQWNLFFNLAALICATGGVIFLFFGQNKLQDFSKELNESQLDICQQASKNVSSFSLASWKQQQQQQQQQHHQETPPRFIEQQQQRRQRPQARSVPLTQSTPVNAGAANTTAVPGQVALARAAWLEAAIQQQQQQQQQQQ